MAKEEAQTEYKEARPGLGRSSSKVGKAKLEPKTSEEEEEILNAGMGTLAYDEFVHVQEKGKFREIQDWILDSNEVGQPLLSSDLTQQAYSFFGNGEQQCLVDRYVGQDCASLEYLVMSEGAPWYSLAHFSLDTQGRNSLYSAPLEASSVTSLSLDALSL